MKRAIIIASCTVSFFILAALITPFCIDLNKYKGKILTLAKPHLPREIDFDSIELSILKGLGVDLQGLRIAENPMFGTEDFLFLERLKIKVKLFPLIKKQIQIKKLLLDKPTIRLVRNAQGEFNFTDLVESKQPEDSEQQEDSENKDRKHSGKDTTETENVLLAGMLVSECSLQQGKIEFIDSFKQKKPIKKTFDRVTIQLNNISLNKPIQISMSGQLPGATTQNLKIDGFLGPLGEKPEIDHIFTDISLFLKEFFLPEFHSFIPEDLPVSPINGTVNVNLRLKGDLATGIISEGNIRCEELILEENQQKKQTEKMLITLQNKMKIMWKKGRIEVNQLDLNINTNNLSMKGFIENIQDNPRWNITLQSQLTDITDMVALYPATDEFLPEDFDFSGAMALEMISEGSKDNLSANIQFSSPRFDFSFPQSIDGTQEGEKSKGFLESLAMEVNATIKNGNIHGTGAMECAGGEALSVALQDMKTNFNYEDDLLRIHDFQVYIFQGEISMDGTVEPQTLRWNMTPTMKDIQMAEAIDLTQYKDLFKGLLSGNFNAVGSSEKNMLNELQVKGSFRLAQGELRNTNLLDSIMDSLFGLKGISNKLGKKRKSLNKHKVTHFDSMDGQLTMADSKILLQKIFLHNIHTSEASGADAQLKGIANLDADTLNLKGEIILSQNDSSKLTNKIAELEALLNQEERLVLPITVTGSLQEPKPFLDTQYVLNAMAKYYGKKGLEKGIESLSEKLGSPKESSSDQEEQGIEKTVDKLFKSIFGK
ncbi:MAG: AsmA family protein [Candidatus Brocadiaceae bacterium]|nr:AsmA family protein [Candidatus Brocadiaceae bacterium]